MDVLDTEGGPQLQDLRNRIGNDITIETLRREQERELMDRIPPKPLNFIPNLACRQWRQYTSDCQYWDYPLILSIDLSKHLQSLPQELLAKIFNYIILPWSPLDQYANVIPNGRSIGLARRNETPLYNSMSARLTSYMLEGRPNETHTQNFITHENAPSALSNAIALHYYIMHNLTDDNRVDLERQVDEENCSMFSEKCGELDYFKESEYFNICVFAKTLMRTDDMRFRKTEFVRLGGKSVAKPKGLLDEFLDWFWDNSVLDLKDGWLDVTDGRILHRDAGVWTSQRWLRIHPEDHSKIRHVTLSLSLSEQKFNPKTKILNSYLEPPPPSNLASACQFLTSCLPNLKSLLLFIHLCPQQATLLLHSPQIHGEGWIPALRLLPFSPQFTLRSGMDIQVTTKEREEERDGRHLRKEKALETLLMSDSSAEKRLYDITSSVVVREMSEGLGLEDEDGGVEGNLGWMEFEGGDGTEFEAGTFFHFQ